MTDLLNVLVVGLLLGGIYSLVSIGLNLIFGVIRIVNFAQGEFVMLGMYGTFAAVTMLHMDPYVSLVLTLPALFLLGVVVQRFLLQPLQNEPMMQIFATFGLLILLQNIVLAMTRGASLSINAPISSLTVSVGPIQVSLVRLVTLAAAALVALGLGWFLHNTLQGRAIRAVAQDRRAARLMGIDVERTFMLTFGIGAALAGLAGTLLTPIYTLSPQIGGNFIVAAFAVVVLGGLGSVTGAFIGGFVVGFTEAIAGFYIDPALKHAVWFSVFIVMLLVRPSGLFGHVGAEEVGLREQH
jgi:branched-chain amino acid transport system permease protein